MLRDTVEKPRTQTYNGILYHYDSSRSKWLSYSRQLIGFGIHHKNISHPQFMKMSGGVNSRVSGYSLVREAVITSVTIQTKSISANCDFKLQKNGTGLDVTTFNLTGVSSLSLDNLNIDLNKDDWIQMLASPVVGITNYPELLIELAWRKP